MKSKILCIMAVAVFVLAMQGCAMAAETGDQLWLRTMTRECVREMVELGVPEGDAEMYTHRYQFMAMAMQGRAGSAEEAGSGLGLVLGATLAEQGEGAMTDAAFAFMAAVRAGMDPEVAAAAEAQLLRSRYTMRNVIRIMTQATEMVRTMQPEDMGEAIGEMIRTMARNMVETETMTMMMAQSGQDAEVSAGVQGAGYSAGSGSGAEGSAGAGQGSGQGNGNGQTGE